MGQLQQRFFSLVSELGFRLCPKPRFPWLLNKINLDAPENGDLRRIFFSLEGDPTALTGKRPRALVPDGFLVDHNRILEFDEIQHFTSHRRKTLDGYPPHVCLGFDREKLVELCTSHSNLAEMKGPIGYRKPKPEFPFEGGRHAQRAFFDACRDLLPIRFGLDPTIRIFETDIPSLLRGSPEQAKREISLAIESALARSQS